MEAFCLFFWRELWCWRETRFILYYTCVYNITHHMKFPPQKHLRLRFNTKRERISPSLHRNGVLKGLKRLTRVQCSWLCIFPSTIFGNPRCRINSELARVSCFFVHFFICQNPEFASSLVKYFAPANFPKVRSTEGRGWVSHWTYSLSLVYTHFDFTILV